MVVGCFGVLVPWWLSSSCLAVVLPNPDPTAPSFSDGWWLQMVVLLIFSVIFGGLLTWFGFQLKRKDRADEQQNQRIEKMAQTLHECQLRCANKTADYVRREDFEARMLRFEEMLVRVHERVDKIAIKLGLEEIGRNG
jgi:hypothetical protein